MRLLPRIVLLALAAWLHAASGYAQVLVPSPPPAVAPASQDTVVEDPDSDVDDTPAAAAPDASTAAPIKPAQAQTDFNLVTLTLLNKVTARAETIDAPIGSSVRFGTIEIIAHSCWKSPPDQQPENAALLDISEVRQGEAPARIFLGWMFSSSPGLSSLENPFYDVSVVACLHQDIKG